MDLVKRELPARTIYNGNGVLNIDGGSYLQIRRGTLVTPFVELQEQVPEGKSWEVHIVVTVKETDA